MSLRVIDPYFGNKTYGNTGKTVKQELSELGLDYADGDTSGLDLGHKRVREFLRYDPTKPVNAINQSRLHILKRCRNHWRSLLRYKRKILKTGEVRDKIVLDETYKHFCDNIRHLLMRNDLNYLKKETDGSVNYRVVGDMKDVHYEEDDEEGSNHSRYQRLTNPISHI